MPEACFLRSPLFAEHRLHGIFSLRSGGVSPPPFDSLNLANDTGDDPVLVEKNLDILIRQSGINGTPHRAVQVHGCRTLLCNGTGRMHREEADILLSDDGSPVAVRVADCTPILLADPASGLVAAVHAGWRGTAKGIAMHAVQSMLDAGAKVENILACIGPCIGPCCFQIGEETADALQQSCAGADTSVQARDGQYVADLTALNRLQLIQAGVRQLNIELLVEGPAACTCCNARHFFSYRRDGQSSGRHLAIVAPIRSA
ncbi:MAG: peptidoglycan editing factor PgeF [Zetaproteobacteria bacterium CG12_big_fil_rev_8_21_14_0_65_55_1124]|nr:MAG: hypothetical protein AUJ58_06760 [Zetaproteobacteria bacterium CG1_02_55_237]PIS19118.1 MAG: peptidoglycan editing factor PgeF [Zetaproteobacteria bacterium CG08_land_8_20_14_0_20_55_17]PIW43711.1 MAG: peptidoglycan editing factor PgeF [Zetaproteobacteria bacterium CG12_big_fil_rev_8_21_14_0_65_55_1124]PIY53130.1 MAG: peptidoglycan editing factor PgeF [Zetaproteobacteria bacterium CG_4_10_14_0_8_um_filter_55_43]PIZ38571.1 MAG: peptidoglycan editing factor PgeF [Zetaproteobacteria bacter